jgi:hypothetical protein
MATMKGNRVLVSLYLDPPIAQELKELSTTTRVPQAVYLREAVEILLAFHRNRDPFAQPKLPIPTSFLALTEEGRKQIRRSQRRPAAKHR